MKTKKCKYCGEEVAKNCKRCPKCGGKLGMPTIVKVLIIFVIIIVFVGACVNSCSKAVDDSIKETENSYKDKNGKTTFKLNETFENKYTKITMTKVIENWDKYDEYTKPADGMVIYAVQFEVENVGDSDEEYFSTLDFNMYADDVDCEEYIWAGDEYKSLDVTLAKGKKANGWILYKVPKGTKSLELIYNADFWLDNTTIKFVVK